MEINVPESLQPSVEAALAWINELKGDNFEVTGIVDYEDALSVGPRETFELGLVLCDGEICEKAQIRFVHDGDKLKFSLVEGRVGAVPALLDPPAGIRENWLDKVLKKHEFVVLLFYRGLW